MFRMTVPAGRLRSDCRLSVSMFNCLFPPSTVILECLLLNLRQRKRDSEEISSFLHCLFISSKDFYLFFLFVFRITGKNVDGCDAVAVFQSLEDDALS